MSLEFVNRICPNCKNPNYMVLLGDFSKAYKYKCMDCNRYFNDIDFEKEPLQPVCKNKYMNTKVDMVEVVRCKDCKWYDERIEEERFIESMIDLWIQPDAPKWIIDYVRQELRKQRGLLEEDGAK